MLRMDESLGFHAAVYFGSFNYTGTWLWDIQFVIYAGLGAYVLAVAGGLFLCQARFALRRCLLAYVLVGFLGWFGYWQFPVVGPVRAWPELFQAAPADVRAATAPNRPGACPHVDGAAGNTSGQCALPACRMGIGGVDCRLEIWP